ncbi:unnamed protein product [Tilletia controversa]|uniref:BHLH domain-containing protein n=3 Tax=Tilletia TaxID=13289 RepID=A0A8X7T151_9BASI|nr:hypothetical protein CF336_g269 [Tilletia laevis]KAE8205536.1 hypothetical protein CF328_g433 [Tilletia controversa]KAE8265481.1 hypothetical protein A4X03_0g225 [Tilletia caries]KAE8208730.1 hypothetical protein CF335_g186 [Tilletia laevis]KAE8256148.1 hypothetical protein A4X06_0g35 [Tilletia controversa]
MAEQELNIDFTDGIPTDASAPDPTALSDAAVVAAAAATVAAASSSASTSHLPAASAPDPSESLSGLPPLGLQGGPPSATYYFNDDPSAPTGVEEPSYPTDVNGDDTSPVHDPAINAPDEDEEMSHNHDPSQSHNIDASDPGGIGPIRHHHHAHHHHHHHDHDLDIDAEDAAALLDPGTAAAVAAAAAAAAVSSSASTSSSSLNPHSSSFKKETPYSRSPELRVSHKLAERKRRREMKDLFDDLRDQLPVERGPKTSKWEILSKATEHIQTLSRQRDELVRELTAFRSGNVSLTSVPPPSDAAPAPAAPPTPTAADVTAASMNISSSVAIDGDAAGVGRGAGGAGARGRKR